MRLVYKLLAVLVLLVISNQVFANSCRSIFLYKPFGPQVEANIKHLKLLPTVRQCKGTCYFEAGVQLANYKILKEVGEGFSLNRKEALIVLLTERLKQYQMFPSHLLGKRLKGTIYNDDRNEFDYASSGWITEVYESLHKVALVVKKTRTMADVHRENKWIEQVLQEEHRYLQGVYARYLKDSASIRAITLEKISGMQGRILNTPYRIAFEEALQKLKDSNLVKNDDFNAAVQLTTSAEEIFFTYKAKVKGTKGESIVVDGLMQDRFVFYQARDILLASFEKLNSSYRSELRERLNYLGNKLYENKSRAEVYSSKNPVLHQYKFSDEVEGDIILKTIAGRLIKEYSNEQLQEIVLFEFNQKGALALNYFHSREHLFKRSPHSVYFFPEGKDGRHIVEREKAKVSSRSGNHVAIIVGLHTNDKGVIEFLDIQQSWGHGVGKNGVVHMSWQYFLHFAYGLSSI